MTDDETTYDVRVHDGRQWHRLEAEAGANLRRLLLRHDLSPYSPWTENVNCGGRGIFATCGVRLAQGPAPSHWHDRLAAHYGYPRLSCQITVDRSLTVYLLPDKRIWGKRTTD